MFFAASPANGALLEEPDAPAYASNHAGLVSDEWERKHDSEPAIFPSLFFTDEEVAAVNWDAVFAQW